MQDVLILGAGPAGLTLALALHRAGIPCRVFEAATEIRAVGVGVNILPHAAAVLHGLGLEAGLAARAVQTSQSYFFNRFGQLIHQEPLGRSAGYPAPQYSIHRADLQEVLLQAARERLGADRILPGHRVAAVEQDAGAAVVRFEGGLPPARGMAAVACDGIHSAVRRQFHPQEQGLRYSGYTMWRGVTRWKPFLNGAPMVRAGWLKTGKMVIYPIRENIDAEGRQLVNWVAEIETPQRLDRDWNRAGRLEDFLPLFADWRFDWLDVPAMLRAADTVLEFPMVDQDPLPWWTQGRITLLGDAAHPMVPRGSNGAGQAILDAVTLSALLAQGGPVEAALKAYEAERLPATTAVVLRNRSNPPDAILREVHDRTGDKPFARIEDVISREELLGLSDGYKQVAGYTMADVQRRAAG
jgi:2-polyprenyl-6-methoxyphenol hydroxylase-like FAD-dependent oxidoreductase